MLSVRQRVRMQWGLVVLGLCLTLYYLAVYRPLSERANQLDRPLTTLWSELMASSSQTGGLGSDSIARIEQGLDEAQRVVASLDQVRVEAFARIEPDPSVRERMNRPFQNIEFQNERQTRLEELTRLAAQAKVGIGPEVIAGFPEFTADRSYPVLLWSQLSFAHHLIAAAVQAPVTTVSVVRLPEFRLHPLRGTNAAGFLAEIPIEVELSGAAASVERFLEALPLRAEELKARGLPEPPPAKPVLFLRQVLLRKEGKEQLDRVRLKLAATGLVRIPAETTIGFGGASNPARRAEGNGVRPPPGRMD